MSAEDAHKRWIWANYYGPNLGYIQEQYEKFANDPESVEPAFRELFARYGQPSSPEAAGSSQPQTYAEVKAPTAALDSRILKKVVDAVKLINNIRTYGHLKADIDPLGLSPKTDTYLFNPETYKLSKADLEAMPASLLWENTPSDVRTGWDVVQRLRQIYTRTIAYEFSHVHDDKERDWLNLYAESSEWPASLTAEERVALLNRLIEVEQFEQFLHRTFAGQKRFSIEGNDVLVPMLDEIVRLLGNGGAEYILMGMAHRGRLNVLAHVLDKPYDAIFSEFHHSPNKEFGLSEGSMGIGWTGDVKYHLGANRSVKHGEAIETRVVLANNPSHLEYVNPIVEGFTRAAQEDRKHAGFPKQDINKAATVIMHGDAAFPGEGVVAETLNFNKLNGYQNGGTIHIIVNNRLGFTTNSEDSRSTHYASDLAKGFEIPIVHVNADDPEACITAVRMACAYRNTFKKDFLIDLIGYRRHGHNEMDDPEATQPLVYSKVKKHPTVDVLYSDQLKRQGIITEEKWKQLNDAVTQKLQSAYEQMKEAQDRESRGKKSKGKASIQPLKITTSVSANTLKEINTNMLKYPDSFKVYPKLQRILQRRATALEPGEKVDWALGEALAFATILADGTPIRISGQDSERGTFAHRHLMLHDYETGKKYSPLHRLPQAKASFAIHNSPLSEESVLGYEYGYNVFAPETLVIWEAQFGDFANAAQVIFDQFISAGRAKWHQNSSLVMLLPHGYEGQGPEHSSARLERFLQLSAEDNWMVANLTTASQYFHLLRRQASIGGTEHARPLVMMSPKSLIRNPRSASDASEFSEGAFRPVLEEPLLGSKPEKVERIVLCSGKVALDLEAEIESDQEKSWDWLHIIRVEQLYPFPEEEIREVLKRYKQTREIVWVQEEPKNMGAWSYMEPRLRSVAPDGANVFYVGRPERSSTATGFSDVHSMEQQLILTSALKHNSFVTNS
ncbi:2-oxoglutarate dehydrogenase E1 component [Marinicrinis lubricantis]|uniref:2-oxoglutarate dehydrogenase E1 component n=1 Tax=Marinicrinis lubricantis TaxID=2086470 RepID=A0ABW1IN62_9BACL